MKNHLPDVTNDQSATYKSPLHLVGMNNVELIIQMEGMTIPAKGCFEVNIDDPDQKGIHMSRLYVQSTKLFEEKPFSGELIEQVLKENLSSQQGISSTSSAKISFTLPIKQPALLTDNAGWRHYEVRFHSSLMKEEYSHTVEINLTYSSTCPCSAALSRKLLQQRIDNSFSSDSIKKEDLLNWIVQEENQTATPHSQRSTAQITMKMKNTPTIQMTKDLIHRLEDGLQTRVQTAIKREDEQEFARLNAENLMFCEDAARKLKYLLQQESDVEGFCVYIEHKESLHPHDAVATAVND